MHFIRVTVHPYRNTFEPFSSIGFAGPTRQRIMWLWTPASLLGIALITLPTVFAFGAGGIHALRCKPCTHAGVGKYEGVCFRKQAQALVHLRQSNQPEEAKGELVSADPPVLPTSKYTVEETKQIGNLVADDEVLHMCGDHLHWSSPSFLSHLTWCDSKVQSNFSFYYNSGWVLRWNSSSSCGCRCSRTPKLR